MASLRRLAGAVGALLLIAALSGCAPPAEQGPAAQVVANDDDGLHGAALDEPYTMPAATLTATDGADFVLPDRLEQPITLVFFGYTRCPDICQVVMADVASALQRIDAEEADKVGMLFITSDPARDDPDTLREYLDRFNPSFEGLTGDLDDIIEVGRDLHIQVEKGPRLPSGGFEVVHGTAVLGVRDDGQVPVLWPEGTSAAELAEDLDALLTGEVAGLRT